MVVRRGRGNVRANGASMRWGWVGRWRHRLNGSEPGGIGRRRRVRARRGGKVFRVRWRACVVCASRRQNERAPSPGGGGGGVGGGVCACGVKRVWGGCGGCGGVARPSTRVFARYENSP